MESTDNHKGEVMGAIKPYNGHHCWNCWNVALWIGNDEPLYNAAMHYVRLATDGKVLANGRKRTYSWPTAARLFKEAYGLGRTPDGAKYTIKALTAALRGLE